MAVYPHPYLPEDLAFPKYHPLIIPFENILAAFFATSGVVLGLTWWVTGRAKHLSTTERVLCCWLVFSGLVHFVVEGAYVISPKFFEDDSGGFFNDLWKEYAKADSRYATRESFVLSMETCTAFLEGPGCLIAFVGMMRQSPWRYSWIALTSLGELYGDVLYYSTCALEGFVHSRPEPLYFWFYFVFMNAIWIVVPALCMGYATAQINRCVAIASKTKAQ